MPRLDLKKNGLGFLWVFFTKFVIGFFDLVQKLLKLTQAGSREQICVSLLSSLHSATSLHGLLSAGVGICTPKKSTSHFYFLSKSGLSYSGGGSVPSPGLVCGLSLESKRWPWKQEATFKLYRRDRTAAGHIEERYIPLLVPASLFHSTLISTENSFSSKLYLFIILNFIY